LVAGIVFKQIGHNASVSIFIPKFYHRYNANATKEAHY
jgi:hypothetical protein